MANVTLKNIYKVYDKDVTAVNNISLDIADKEFVVLVGPSGCGKSTTLRMIAGLEEVTKGELFIEERMVNDVAPKDRNIAMVFQNYALYPHMNVYDNMAFALKLRKIAKKEIDKRVREAANILGIESLLIRKPKQLSGGQRQRVAIGRAIVRNPKVFLMDEPLSNLDAKLRNQMRSELIKLHKRLDTTFIYVTHDQIEAMTLGNRIVVMNDGVIQQNATPQEIYNHPANIFVASFIGTPQMNIYENATLERDGDRFYVRLFERLYSMDDKRNQILLNRSRLPKNIIVGIRSDDMDISNDKEKSFKVDIDVRELMGAEMYLHVKFPSKYTNFSLNNDAVKKDGFATAVLKVRSDINIEEDKQININLNENKLHVFDAESHQSLFA